MDLGLVMQEIADRLDTIAGLRVSAYPAGNVTPPAAMVLFPDEIDYDQTYGRGMDRMTLPVLVIDGVPTERQTRDRIAAYAAGSGAASVKAVLESGTYTQFHTVVVTRVEFPAATIGGQDYAAAMFDLDITGQGS